MGNNHKSKLKKLEISRTIEEIITLIPENGFEILPILLFISQGIHRIGRRCANGLMGRGQKSNYITGNNRQQMVNQLHLILISTGGCLGNKIAQWQGQNTGNR